MQTSVLSGTFIFFTRNLRKTKFFLQIGPLETAPLGGRLAPFFLLISDVYQARVRFIAKVSVLRINAAIPTGRRSSYLISSNHIPYRQIFHSFPLNLHSFPRAVLPPPRLLLIRICIFPGDFAILLIKLFGAIYTQNYNISIFVHLQSRLIHLSYPSILCNRKKYPKKTYSFHFMHVLKSVLLKVNEIIQPMRTKMQHKTLKQTIYNPSNSRPTFNLINGGSVTIDQRRIVESRDLSTPVPTHRNWMTPFEFNEARSRGKRATIRHFRPVPTLEAKIRRTTNRGYPPGFTNASMHRKVILKSRSGFSIMN